MGTEDPTKRLFGLNVSKEFLIALCSVIFGAGACYMKLNNIDSAMGDLKKSIEEEQKNFTDVNIAEKLLENRVLSLEQKSQPQQHK